jgi:hypothetical protein
MAATELPLNRQYNLVGNHLIYSNSLQLLMMLCVVAICCQIECCDPQKIFFNVKMKIVFSILLFLSFCFFIEASRQDQQSVCGNCQNSECPSGCPYCLGKYHDYQCSTNYCNMGCGSNADCIDPNCKVCVGGLCNNGSCGSWCLSNKDCITLQRIE